MNEEWRPVEGYEGLYEVSNLGRVKSLGKWCVRRGGAKAWYGERIRKPQLIGHGYHFVVLYKDNIGKTHYVHRLVASAFIPNDDPVNKTTVNHKNEDKLDNRVENLEWMSVADNVRYGTAVERTAAAKRGKPSPLKGRKRPEHVVEAMKKAYSKPVIQYDMTGNEVARYPSTKEAGRQTGFSQANIWACCAGKYKQAYGFIWKYAKDVENA